MKILFTGASSFTGHWFVGGLAAAGHDVVATFTRDSAAAYTDPLRSTRIERIAELCQPVYSCQFGDDQFLGLIRDDGIDLICHHGADVTDYKSANFDVGHAVSRNTHRARQALESLAANRGARFLLTGSVFEGGEGAGSEGLPHFSPYGLSKALTAQAFEYYCETTGVPWGKFVIPNPFGPYEDPRFTAYLIRTWAAGEVPKIRTPDYIRDNIHISLLASAYVDFAERVAKSTSYTTCHPSGYVESQGLFAERVAREISERTNWTCPIEYAQQSDFAEPLVRINTDHAVDQHPEWIESTAWDAMADFYLSTLERARALSVA